jgi:hypothetical protein
LIIKTFIGGRINFEKIGHLIHGANFVLHSH